MSQDLRTIEDEINADLSRICHSVYWYQELALIVSLCNRESRLLSAPSASGSADEIPYASRMSWYGIGFELRACVFPNRGMIDAEVVPEEAFRFRCRRHDPSTSGSGLRCCW